MALEKKTTILFSPGLHKHLTGLAKQRSVSMGDLVRSACEAQYGYTSPDERLACVRRLIELSLPVGAPSEMKKESLVPVQEILP